jgi:hypothetical protein
MKNYTEINLFEYSQSYNRGKGYFRPPVIVTMLFLLLCTLPSMGKETNIYRWEFCIGGADYYVTDSNYWNFGPELTVQYAFSVTGGMYAAASYPAVRMTSRGYGFREGFPMDIGGWLSPRRWTSRLKLGAGLSHIFGSDSDGSEIKGFGAHFSAHGSFWFSKNIGAWVRGVFRFWFAERRYDSKFSPSFSAGIGFRF